MKNKRHFPMVMRKEIKNFSALKESCLGLLAEPEEKLRMFDNDKNFKLSDLSGDTFVRSNNKKLYSSYSVVAFHDMSDEGLKLENELPYGPEMGPRERQIGMKTLKEPYYHPRYDERQYTKYTPYCLPEIKNFLENFSPYGEKSCRSSMVVLSPGMYLDPHYDMGPEFASRFQVSIETDGQTEMGFRKNKNYPWEVYVFEEGFSYFVNTGYEHYAINYGDINRYQVRVCVIGQQLLSDYSKVDPNYTKDKWNG